MPVLKARSPLVLPDGLAGSGGGVVGRKRFFPVFGERFDGWGRDGLDGEGAGDADFRLIYLRPVVEGFLRCVPLDARVDLGQEFPPGIEELCVGYHRRFRPCGVGIERHLPLFEFSVSGGIEDSARAFSTFGWCFSWMTSISGLFAMDLRVMCGTVS